MLSHSEFARLANLGGASRNFTTLQEAQGPGVMVSKPGAEQISKAPLTADQAKYYFKGQEVQATGREYHGAWKSGGKMFQDVSRKYETLNEARSAGEKGKQIAGYDLGGTDVRRPEGGNIYFSRKVKGIETEPEFKETETGTSAPERMAARPRGKDATEQVLLSRGATYKGKPITIGQVYSKIAKNRRNRGV